MNIINYIPVGKKNAVTRTELCMMTGQSDRIIRRQIHEARREHVIINLQDSQGYYRPDMSQESEIAEIRRFLVQEEKRLRSIGWSLKSARMALREASQ